MSAIGYPKQTEAFVKSFLESYYLEVSGNEITKLTDIEPQQGQEQEAEQDFTGTLYHSSNYSFTSARRDTLQEYEAEPNTYAIIDYEISEQTAPDTFEDPYGALGLKVIVDKTATTPGVVSVILHSVSPYFNQVFNEMDAHGKSIKMLVFTVMSGNDLNFTSLRWEVSDQIPTKMGKVCRINCQPANYANHRGAPIRFDTAQWVFNNNRLSISAGFTVPFTRPITAPDARLIYTHSV